MSYHIISYYIVLYCIKYVYYIIHMYIILYICIVYYIIFYYIILHCIILYHIILCYIILYYIISYYMWIADTLWYCYCWSLDVVWCSMVSMVKWRRASALHCFTVDLQFGVLSQRSSMIRAPWLEIIRLFTWGYWLYCGCIPIRTPHAWLILSVTRRRVDINSLNCDLRLLN